MFGKQFGVSIDPCISRVTQITSTLVRGEYFLDPTVQVAALIVIGCALSSEPIVPETKTFMLDSEGTTSGFPWILDKCLTNTTKDNNAPVSVKLESLQVMSTMSRNYFDCLVVPYLAPITDGLVACLQDQFPDLRLHAGRTVDFIGQTINQHYGNKGMDA